MKLLLSDCNGNIHVIPDSAIGRDSQPWFLPDFGADWQGYEAVALRVSRLGKGIAPKFAERYADAMTTLWVAESLDCPTPDYMDGRVVVGSWHDIVDTQELEPLLALLVQASQCATLKNGDIIALALPGTSQPLQRNMHISNACLSFNIK